MLGYFICFSFTVNPGQIAMWDSGFLIEVYSTLCQALGQCRWAKKANEKRKKHGSSKNVSERKTAGREKGRACGIFLNTSICPLPRPLHVNMSKCQNLQGRIRASSRAQLHVNNAFQGGVLDSISRPSFKDRPALKELYDTSPDVLGRRFLELLFLQQNSLNSSVRFANSEGI